MAGSPWTNQVVSLIILTEAATGFSGLFGYNPTPAAGNLVFSVAAAAGTDPYGNAYVSGITSYSGSSYVQMLSDHLNFFVAGVFQTQQLLIPGAGEMQLSSGLQSALDIGASILCLSSAANSGSSGITLNAATVTATSNAVISGNLTVNIVTVNSGASITGGLTVDTINGSANTGTPSINSTSSTGLPDGTIHGTSGGASAGTAHTHGPGSFAVGNGVHSHDLQNHEHAI